MCKAAAIKLSGHSRSHSNHILMALNEENTNNCIKCSQNVMKNPVSIGKTIATLSDTFLFNDLKVERIHILSIREALESYVQIRPRWVSAFYHFVQ